ncbi:MAG: phosphoribosyltransferase family protein [bacterium]|nr:phosphoribosyltransferase family protein [bacterium]
MMFKDRRDAGKKLAEALKKYKNAPDTIVLALPRGGVVTGYEITKALNLPLDIVVPRKIGAPSNPEYAVGAITETGQAILNEEEIKDIEKEWLEKEKEKEKKEAQRRLMVYRTGPPLVIKGKTVIIVDDGVATGYTMRAAIASIKIRKPAKIIAAVPHGASDSIKLIKKEADEVVCLFAPVWYGAVGSFYENFPQTTDEEVIKLLKR